MVSLESTASQTALGAVWKGRVERGEEGTTPEDGRVAIGKMGGLRVTADAR